MTFKHGFAREGKIERLHNIWRDIKKRCRHHPDYAGRGIKLCSEWGEYVAFRGWAMVSGYVDGLTIDRIDNDGDYCPSNCRWTDKKQQARNRRSSRLLAYNGEIKSLAQWCDDLGLDYQRTHKRLNQLGWPISKAFANPPPWQRQ